MRRILGTLLLVGASLILASATIALAAFLECKLSG